MNALPELASGKVVLLIGPHAAQVALIELAAHLARHGPVRVMDGGNQFNAYRLARSLRRGSTEMDAALGRVSLARAFTCYQMETMLALAQAIPAPTLVMDLLATFYDESVPFAERRRLVGLATRHLRRLSALAPVAVGARPVERRPTHFYPGMDQSPAGEADRATLFAMLRDAADAIWELDLTGSSSPPGTQGDPQPLQPSLF